MLKCICNILKHSSIVLIMLIFKLQAFQSYLKLFQANIKVCLHTLLIILSIYNPIRCNKTAMSGGATFMFSPVSGSLTRLKMVPGLSSMLKHRASFWSGSSMMKCGSPSTVTLQIVRTALLMWPMKLYLHFTFPVYIYHNMWVQSTWGSWPHWLGNLQIRHW